MKDANKRLMMSIAVLVIAISLAATSTFAWLTMDTTPQVDNIDVAISVQDGLYVSTSGDDGDYYTRINLTGSVTTGLDAITPKDETTGFSFITIQDGTLGTSEASEAYAKITLYIRSQSNYNIHIKSLTVTAADPQGSGQNLDAWRAFSVGSGDPFTAAQGAELPVTAVVENALRVGFSDGTEMLKIVNPKSGLGWENATYYPAFNAAHDYFKTVNVMDVDERAAFDAAWANPNTADFDIIVQTDLGGMDEDDLLFGSLDEGNPVGGLTKIVEVGSSYYSDWATPVDWYVATLDVYVWAEGTDPDCFNEILKDGASISFELAGDYVATT